MTRCARPSLRRTLATFVTACMLAAPAAQAIVIDSVDRSVVASTPETFCGTFCVQGGFFTTTSSTAGVFDASRSSSNSGVFASATQNSNVGLATAGGTQTLAAGGNGHVRSRESSNTNLNAFGASRLTLDFSTTLAGSYSMTNLSLFEDFRFGSAPVSVSLQDLDSGAFLFNFQAPQNGASQTGALAANTRYRLRASTSFSSFGGEDVDLDWRFDFQATAPTTAAAPVSEPGTQTALAGGLMLALAAFRRRGRRPA